MNKILVIDSDATTREGLCQMIITEGFSAQSAENCEEGLAKTASYQPELVILDIGLPESVAFLVRLEVQMHPYRVIGLTTEDASFETEESYRNGLRSFVRKPVLRHELLGHIQQNLKLINLTHRIRAETTEKDQALQLIKSAIDSLSEGVMRISGDQIIQTVSHSARETMELESVEVIGRSAMKVLGEKVAGSEGILAESKEKKEVISWRQTEFLLPSGAVVPVAMTAIPLNWSGENEGWLLLFRDIRKEIRAVWDQVGGTVYGKIISNDPVMKSVFQKVEKIHGSHSVVLIEGESGTGKELIAREIHERSQRARNPFLVINCSAVPAHVLERELFGVEQKLENGEILIQKGKLDAAIGGTLFLDEIGDVPLSTQAKIIYLLQEYCFEREGGERRISADVRVIAATNRNLKVLVEGRAFREDLFHHLDVLKFNLPPLRERIHDIPLLISQFVNRLNRTESREVTGLSREATLALMSYLWPGNVRELSYSIEHAFAVSTGDLLEMAHLPEKIVTGGTATDNPAVKMRKNEKDLLMESLEQVSYDKKMAAKLLGVSLATFYRKLNKHHLEVPRKSRY